MNFASCKWQKFIHICIFFNFKAIKLCNVIELQTVETLCIHEIFKKSSFLQTISNVLEAICPLNY